MPRPPPSTGSSTARRWPPRSASSRPPTRRARGTSGERASLEARRAVVSLAALSRRARNDAAGLAEVRDLAARRPLPEEPAALAEVHRGGRGEGAAQALPDAAQALLPGRLRAALRPPGLPERAPRRRLRGGLRAA